MSRRRRISKLETYKQEDEQLIRRVCASTASLKREQKTITANQTVSNIEATPKPRAINSSLLTATESVMRNELQESHTWSCSFRQRGSYSTYRGKKVQQSTRRENSHHSTRKKPPDPTKMFEKDDKMPRHVYPLQTKPSAMQKYGSKTQPFVSHSKAATRDSDTVKSKHPDLRKCHPHKIITNILLIQDIHALSTASTSPTSAVNTLQNNLKGFLRILRQKLEPKEMNSTMMVLYKVAECLQYPCEIKQKAIQILAEVLSTRCAEFHIRLKLYATRDISECRTCICDLEAIHNHKYQECKVHTLYAFFKTLLETIPSVAWSILPINHFVETVTLIYTDTNPALVSEICILQQLQTESRQLLVKTRLGCSQEDLQTWNNSEFRKMSIFPEWNEICNPDPPSRLRSNIVHGSYIDWMHYYDVQFRLLREDFLAPLRRGICEYRKGNRGRQLRDIKVYKDAVLKGSSISKEGFYFKIKFDISHMKHIKWEHSKRLLYGSLLCFSPDNFREKAFFAIVTNRKESDLYCGELEVQFQRDIELLSLYRKQHTFVVVESSAYFEATRHIMASLQNAETDTMPFTSSLINNNCEAIAEPHYFLQEQEFIYDLQSMYPEDTTKQTLHCVHSKNCLEHTEEIVHSKMAGIDTCHFQWPQQVDTVLDGSQLDALKMALTQEIAVIQGPPGTGKTFIGIKIVQTLLANKKQWDPTSESPILVMCLTNHALDQFLEGILPTSSPKGTRFKGVCPKLVRIGSRSKSDRINEFNIKEARKKDRQYVPRFVKNELTRSEVAVERQGEKVKACLQRVNEVQSKFLTFNELESEIKELNPEHHYQLLNEAEIPEQQEKALEIWLRLWESYTEDSPVSSTKGHNGDSSDQQSHNKQSPIPGTHSSISFPGGENTEAVKNFDLSGCSKEDYDKEPKRLSRAITKLRKIKDFGNQLKRGLIQRKFKEDQIEEKRDLNVRSLEHEDRWKLYNYWRHMHLLSAEAECEREIKRYNDCCERLKVVKQNMDRFTLEKADIIGMTTTGAAKNQHILHLVKPRIVIVEEAAEVLESHIVSALNAGTQQLILIGDHKQLRPKPNEYDLVKRYNLDISLFERLIQNQFPHATLNIQHRMRPEIANLVRPHIYTSLVDHSSVEDYDHVKGLQQNLFFIQHKHKEKHDENLLSHSNVHEANFLVALCRYLLQQGYKPQQISILVTYTGQLLLVKSLMQECTFSGVIIRTVDNYQGEENDLVLLSLVRSNDDGNVGFLREDNRVCVALSRAKAGFYCVGNFNMLREKSSLWEAILNDMESNALVSESLPICCAKHPSTIINVKEASDFRTYSPNGGCKLDCQFRLQCGHVCSQKCHSSDLDHSLHKCQKMCGRKCPNGHDCPKACYKDCGNCQTPVIRLLPCGHEASMSCYKLAEKVVCDKTCKKLCSLGHPCSQACFQKCKCTMEIPKHISKCGHTQMMPCYQDPSTFKCRESCDKICEQGHLCQLKCSEKCKCATEVQKTIPSCGHTEKVPCYQDPSNVKCMGRCDKKCKVGHPCQKKCYEECEQCTVEVEKVFAECSHKLKVLCYQSLKLTICTVTYDTTLKCGHSCKKTCGAKQDPKCKKLVCKELPCGHKTSIPCYQSMLHSNDVCKMQCKKLLPCKHPCTNPSGKPCSDKCPYPVFKKRPCFHRYRSKCCDAQKAPSNPCLKKCEQLLPCGHKCIRRCGEKCTSKCNVEYQTELACGHRCKLPCYIKCDTFSCDALCRKKLACGHRCAGVCGECTAKRRHHPCIYSMRIQLFCGHQINVQCINLSDNCAHKQTICLSHCVHQTCTNGCASECSKCKQPCPWNCPHFTCTKLCHEVCDRPPCNERCNKRLKCGHQCVGVCGEPCLTVCPVCDPKEFNKLLSRAKNHDEDELYIQLNCGHIYTLNSFDKYVKDQTCTDSAVMPICCTKCRRPAALISNYRYGNACKQKNTEVRAVQETMHILATRHTDSNEKAILLDHRLTVVLERCLEKIDSALLTTDVQKSKLEIGWCMDRYDKLYLFRSLPYQTKAMLQLQDRLAPDNFTDVSSQENFLNTLLVNTAEHVCAYAGTHNSDILTLTYSFLANTKEQLLTYLEMLFQLVREKSQLSIQIIEDITSEMYRLSLMVQLSLVKCQKVRLNSVTSPSMLSLESFLNDHDQNFSLKVNESQYMQHSAVLKDMYNSESIEQLPLDSDMLVRDIRESTPPVLKGHWRKCSKEHYYCSPLTIAKSKVIASCQECTRPPL